MYAIVDIAGQQFKVEKNREIFVHRLDGKEGSSVQFDEVLMIGDGGKAVIGSPHIKGAAVTARILEHTRGNKVLVFKKKNRKGYQKLNGHRQYLTKVQILSIIESGATPQPKAEPAAAKAPARPIEQPKEAPAAEVKKETRPAEAKAKAADKPKAVPKAASKAKPAAKATPKAATKAADKPKAAAKTATKATAKPKAAAKTATKPAAKKTVKKQDKKETKE